MPIMGIVWAYGEGVCAEGVCREGIAKAIVGIKGSAKLNSH